MKSSLVAIAAATNAHTGLHQAIQSYGMVGVTEGSETAGGAADCGGQRM
ncbi:hypothetical protein [Halotia branconii]|uniref:Uncharacterized protein n=1 Tax=Halotia branconii CENA392 TaxID=1539056 RepID=A0AAJ6P817_9CYAN|nr:hypothetical protein [Halotia branconii]WGV24225.1 hypothetical protein QI031_20850 [Halotia branconii CENA392]